MQRLVLAGLVFILTQAGYAQRETIDTDIATLTARLEKLEGTRAVKKLQRAFGYYMDRGLWGEAADLFAADGSIEIGMDGVYTGQARIREYLKRLHGNQEGLIYGQLNEWITLQPVVSMGADGRSATARWRDHAMLGQYQQYAQWRDGIYENTYVREDGVWKLKTLHLYINFVAPYASGWARLRPGEGLQPSETSKDFPADQRPTEVYQAFPATQIPPFQAPNPVTGKPVRGAR